MPIITLKDFAKSGVNSDLAPWDLDPSFLTAGSNYRISNGKVESFGGYINLSLNSAAGFKPGFMMYVPTEDDEFWLVAGNNAVYAFNGATWSNISNSAGYAGVGTDEELLWNGSLLGHIPVINNINHYPEYWHPQSTSTLMNYLTWDTTAVSTWASVNNKCKVMRAHKSHLMALNMTEGGTDYPDILRWSHPAEGGSLPVTWDETNTAFLAGKTQPLGSRIIDGHSLRDSFVVYSENNINVMDYTNDTFVFRIRELTQTAGLLAPRCIAEVKGSHLLLADGDIVMNDGNAVKSIIHNRLRRRLNANISTDTYDRSFAVKNDAKKEVWFCVPEDSAAHPNMAYIYNWRDDSWSIRDLPTITHAGYGPRATPSTGWNSVEGTWDTNSSVWGSRTRTPLDDHIMGIDTNGQLTQLDNLDTNDGTDSSSLERTDLPLAGHNKVTTITRAYPHMEGTIPVDIQLGSQEFAGGPIAWKPAVTFTPGIDRKVDIRTTGALHTWKVSSNAPGNWSLSGIDIEYEEAGLR